MASTPEIGTHAALEAMALSERMARTMLFYTFWGGAYRDLGAGVNKNVTTEVLEIKPGAIIGAFALNDQTAEIIDVSPHLRVQDTTHLFFDLDLRSWPKVIVTLSDN